MAMSKASLKRDQRGRPLRKIVGMASDHPFNEYQKSHRRVYLDCGHVVVTRRQGDEYCHSCRPYRRKEAKA